MNSAIIFSEVSLKEGFAENGGMYYEKEDGKLLNEFHWWPQAGAVVGFLNSWQISKDDKYLLQTIESWNFITKYNS